MIFPPHAGRYACIIQTNEIPYIQWQNIVIKQRPTITVGDPNRVFSCEDNTVQLRCSVDAGYSIEWVLNEAVQASGCTYKLSVQVTCHLNIRKKSSVLLTCFL